MEAHWSSIDSRLNLNLVSPTTRSPSPRGDRRRDECMDLLLPALPVATGQLGKTTRTGFVSDVRLTLTTFVHVQTCSSASPPSFSRFSCRASADFLSVTLCVSNRLLLEQLMSLLPFGRSIPHHIARPTCSFAAAYFPRTPFHTTFLIHPFALLVYPTPLGDCLFRCAPPHTILLPCGSQILSFIAFTNCRRRYIFAFQPLFDTIRPTATTEATDGRPMFTTLLNRCFTFFTSFTYFTCPSWIGVFRYSEAPTASAYSVLPDASVVRIISLPSKGSKVPQTTDAADARNALDALQLLHRP
ncbi:unnamed protein product [Protopolystoma xenopodis]|uniref:Uncharacterized protein n=1 Tax=Protopolystoma xenopodis TaxID=117903 RepID=A0A448WDP2_9PLAT|nr:unnamed protein product [Protopolystoma xenopodis]